jgi:ABC-type glycerol-3-phosphate transport system substrate-binding protein
LCEAANIDIGRISTFDDYMAAGRRFRERHPRSYLMNIGRKPIHWLYFMILSHWDGVQIADRNGRFRLTTDPAFARLLTWLKTWKDSGIAFNTDDFEPDWQPAFADGTIAGSLIATWMTDFLPRFAPQQGGRWGIALWPEFNRSGSEAGGAVFAIPARARNKEAAFEFLAKMFLEPTGAADEWQRTGNPAVIRSVRPELLERSRTMTRPDGITDAAWATNPGNFFGRDFMQPVFDSFDAFRVFPYDPAAQRELDIMRQHTEAHLAGTKTLEAALRDMEADMRRQIGNPYRP